MALVLLGVEVGAVLASGGIDLYIYIYVYICIYVYMYT